MLDRRSPNSIVLQGECPLHVSVKRNRVQSTKVILEQGADANLQVCGCHDNAWGCHDNAWYSQLVISLSTHGVTVNVVTV